MRDPHTCTRHKQGSDACYTAAHPATSTSRTWPSPHLRECGRRKDDPVRIDFESITITMSKHGKCPVCGFKTTRTRRFEQTVSPWNRGADGRTLTRAEVQGAVSAEAIAWVPDFRHAACVADEAVADEPEAARR